MEIKKICVVGLGYVGLPLAVELSQHFEVIGMDNNSRRISELNQNHDASREVASEALRDCGIIFTSDPSRIREAEVVIACVPTPVDKNKKPDLFCLQSVSKTIGENLQKHAIVVYESTVYPGVTEEVCVPLLEQHSGLRCGAEFKVGYSPERMNPGDKEHAISKITKIVSGMDAETLSVVDYVYSKITTTHKASSIKVAEAAKVIENIQRDLNIALMNELTIIFDKMGIDVHAVIEAASTKWNFHRYYPGLVGGHCIGVDPYYLTYKAEEYGYHQDVILAGRRINDNMHKFFVEKIIKKLQKINGKKVLVMGLTFKPNVPDYRNSRVKYFIQELKEFGITVYAYDPYLGKDIIEREFEGIYLNPQEGLDGVDLAIIATKHHDFISFIKNGTILPEKL